MPIETVASLLAWARTQLGERKIDTAALDARLLLQQATGLDYGSLVGRSEQEVSQSVAADFRELIARRCRREPVSRIIGTREFYGRNFRLGPATLDPRPDTETLIEAALAHLRHHPAPRILDLGTGTGAIAITLLAEMPGAYATATDISQDALTVAALNARQHGVEGRLKLLKTSWFSRLDDCFDLIISNPPYLESDAIESLEAEVKDWDPRPALDGGTDGLDCYREIATGAVAHLLPQGQVIVEIGAGQAEEVTKIFVARGLEIRTMISDLGGHVRCLVFGIRKMGVGNAADLSYIPTR